MRVVLDHVEPAAENIFSFYFRPERPVRYTAGQFIELTVPHPDPDERGQRHWFTLASSPTEPLPMITTKFPAGGQTTSTFKQALRKLQPGDEILMSDPMGDFVLPKNKTTPLTFIAGGIGVTPMRSMIKWLHDTQEHRTIHLLYAANTMDEIAFRDIFSAYGLPVTFILNQPPPQWDGETGRLSAEKILSLEPDVDGKLYYISGPEPMVETIVADMQKRGVNKRQLIGDYFPNYT